MAGRTIEPSREARCRGDRASPAAPLAVLLFPCLAFLAILAPLPLSACENGSPATPTFRTLGTFEPRSVIADSGIDGGAADATLVDAGSGEGGDATVAKSYPLCPDAMAPTFPSIVSEMLASFSCGSEQNECHSSIGALPIWEAGGGSRLDFSLDAQALYVELLGADGGGYPSTNLYDDGGPVVLRVAPGDAGASMLYIKLALPTPFDRRYGFVMPPNGLGSLVCPQALDTIGTWIDNGAPPN
jgi:hypothetical protein